MKKGFKLWVILLITVTMFTFLLPRSVSFAKIPEPKNTLAKISTEFSSELLDTNRMVNVIVEAKGSPFIPYAKNLGLDPRESIAENVPEMLQYVRNLTVKQLGLINEIKRIAPLAKVGYRYHYTCNGFSLTLPGKDIEKIANLEGIEKIYPSKTYTISGDLSGSIIGAPEVWKMKDANGNPLDGKGMLIGIIDTGIDYTHPDLGGGFGPNYKVVGGYDFGDNDSDPMDQEGHGTHVAGIAAANGKIKGVAPEAHLMAYKIVAGGNPSASDSTIIAAIERAVKDKCDAVNLSFGSGQLGTANPDDPENKAFDNAADAGVLSAVAAGNQGSRCESTPYPLGAPSGAPKVISVAASDDGLHPSINIVSPSVPENQRIITGNYADLSPDFPQDEEFEVVPCGYGRKSDFASVNVKGKIALVSRGPIGANALYFRDKDLNAEAAGAAGIIIYNNLPGIVNPTFQVTPEDADKTYVPAIFVTMNDGLFIKSLINKGLKIKFGKVSGLGTMASFSSMGPTSDFYFKPEVAAPGVAINSTIPNGKYAKWDGTSMATPHVTGAIALIKQAHPDWTSEDIKASLMNTATVLKNYQNGEVITWTLQGSGRIDIPPAIKTPAVITPYDLLLKTDNLKPVKFTVKNVSDAKQKFDISYEITNGGSEGLSLKFSTNTLSVNKGSTATLTATFNADADKLSKGPHEGVIYLDNGNAKLHVPFIIWNGDVEIPEKLSNVSASSDIISPGAKKDNTIEFKFRLGSGSLIPPTEPKDRPTNSNIIDEMQVRVEDMDGNELGIIYQRSLLLLGDYSFTWDGKDVYGNYFLKDGTYKWVVAAVESNNDENNPKIEDAAKVEGTFTVVNAPNTKAAVFPDKSSIVQEDQTSAAVVMDTGKKLNAFTGIIFFNPNIMQVSDVKEGDFFKSAGETEFSANVDNMTGEIFVNVSLKDGKTASGDGAIVMFTIKGRLPGKTKIGFEESNFKDANGQVVDAVFAPSFIMVSKAENPWDLNRDKVVDDKDLAIFKGVFGLQANNPDFLPLADFNEDGVIDGKDLIILAQHIGEKYP
jgi:minor extracellular serine protease Vpr